MEFQAEHCLPITGQPDDVTVTALVGADGFSKPCGGAGIPTGISANNPLVPGMYVDDLAKCQLETLPYEDLHLTQRIVRPEGGITFGQEGGCTVRRGDIRDGITLFRGDCSEGNETNDGSWTFDVTSNETFIDRMMHLNAAPRAFAKCPDDSTLRQTWSAWFGRKPANAAARRTLPVTQGIYLNTVAMGTDVTACATGMDSDAALDVSPGVLNFYESRCEVLSSAAGPQPNALNLSLRCTGEGQTWETDSVFRRTSESAFDLDDTRYQLCLVGDASPPGDSTETVPLTDPSERRHVLRGFKNQGIVFTMTIGTKRTSDGVVVRLLKATGTHNPQGNFNPVVAGADVSLSLHVVTRKTCQGCKPGFVEQSPPGLRFSDGQLEVTSLPVEVFVPNAALAGADVIGFALLGVEIGKGRLFLTPETLLIADLDAVPTGGINDDVAVPSASDTPEMTAGTVAIAGELLEVYNRDRTRMALVADNADYAVLAWAAYGQPEAFDAASDRGWNAMESVVNDNLITGDTAAMRFAAADGSQVLAFRGSKTLGDWFTNTVGTLVPSPLTKGQISGAVEIALVMQSQYPDIVFVGHSLGGRLAQVARLRTGNKAVTFNSAPLNLEETGDAVARKLIEALMGRPGITSDVYRFRNPQDALTALSTREQIEVSNVMTAEGIEGFAHLNFPRLATYFAMQQVEVYHSMGMLAGAMQQVKFMRDSEFLEGSAVDLILGGAVVEPAGEAVDPEFEPSSKIKEIYLFDMNYLTKLGLARYFGAPVEVISEGVFPAGIREANQFEQRRMQAAFMATVEQVAQGFAGTDTFKIYLDAQGNGENRNALGQFNFDTMKYRLCLPSNFAMPMDGIGIRGNTFEPGILIRYPTKTKSDMNCSYGELASQRRHSHRSDEYIDINMPNEAVAEAFEVNVKPNLMLRVICDLNASTIALGPNPDGRYRRQKPFKGWPLVCEANKVEGYIDDHAIPAFEIDFTTASPKFSTVIQ